MGFYSWSYAEISLMVHRAESESRWPPTFPRRGTLLTPSNDPTIPRASWGSDEWRAYALFLEDAGGVMARRLQSALDNLADARVKLRRRRNNISQSAPSLLFGTPAAKKKPGRKPADHTRMIAEAVLNIRADAESKGLTMTDRLALAEYYGREGKRRTRANESPARHILNTVSKLRRSHVI